MSRTILVLAALCSATLGLLAKADGPDHTRLLDLVNKYNSAVTSAARTKDTAELFAMFADNVTITSYYNDGQSTEHEGSSDVEARFDHRLGALKQIIYDTPYEVFVHPAYNRIVYTTMFSTVGNNPVCLAYSKLVVETMFDNDDKIVQIIQFFDAPAFHFHSLLEQNDENSPCNLQASKATRYEKALTAFTRARIDLYYATHSDSTVDGATLTMENFYDPDMRGEFGDEPIVGSEAIKNYVSGMFTVIEYDGLYLRNIDMIASGLHATYLWKAWGASKQDVNCRIFGTTRLIIEMSHQGAYKLAREYTVGLAEGIGACVAQAEKEL